MNVIGEPPAGATPPDVVPPSEPPKVNFSVEVQQPELLLKLALVNASKQIFSTNICEVDIPNDPLFSSTEFGFPAHITELRHYIDPHDPDHLRYLFSTSLRLSKYRQEVNNGYISIDEVGRIAKALEAKGYQAKVQKNSEEGNVIEFSKGTPSVTMSLGYESRAVQGAYIRRKVQEEQSAGKPDSYTKYVLPSFESGGEGYDYIYLAGWPKELQPSPIGEVDFTQDARGYASFYTDAVNAFYEAEGLQAPNKRAILRPPILNEDALSEIKSVERESPPLAVEQQIKKDITTFAEIAGQDQAVAEAKRLVLAINSPEVFEKRGVKRPKGILFYGPPGTGKTLIAKAVAAEANALFIEVSTADIGTKWYGESERLMQKVFDSANNAVAKGQKVVLFFDELDSLAPSRENAFEATKKVVATLLQNMDGMRTNPNVTIIAATNRPQDIDPALKRPGRIDKLIHVGLPDVNGRQAILKVHMEKAKKAATAAGELFSENIDLAQIGQATEGMSGADLANLINLTLEDKTIAELEGQAWTPISTDKMLATAKKLGAIKEEKRRMGFTIPENPQQNGTQTSPQAGEGKQQIPPQ